MLTVACVWVKGSGESKRKYGVEYVDRLRNMVSRNLKQPHRMVCLTDRPGQVPKGIEPISIENPKFGRGWWAKLNLFDPAMPFTERVLYLDLDVLIVGPLDPMADYPADFVLCPDSAPTWTGFKGKRAIKAYNSSVMAFNRGARPQIFETFTPEVADDLWSDQDWIAQSCPNEVTFPKDWVRRLKPTDSWPAETKVILCIKIKNHQADLAWNWFKDYWR